MKNSAIFAFAFGFALLSPAWASDAYDEAIYGKLNELERKVELCNRESAETLREVQLMRGEIEILQAQIDAKSSNQHPKKRGNDENRSNPR